MNETNQRILLGLGLLACCYAVATGQAGLVVLFLMSCFVVALLLDWIGR